ncbi:unnamed protein product [Linum trigynum]|uniref:Uncharacterized protein n=1 Tax=Linum trigynum TaxID=586398 RepID=A0AAV2G3Y1_9ROSI
MPCDELKNLGCHALMMLNELRKSGRGIWKGRRGKLRDWDSPTLEDPKVNDGGDHSGKLWLSLARRLS